MVLQIPTSGFVLQSTPFQALVVASPHTERGMWGEDLPHTSAEERRKTADVFSLHVFYSMSSTFGFFSSGSSVSKEIVRRPSSNLTFFTSTYSAKANLRLNARLAMPW